MSTGVTLSGLTALLSQPIVDPKTGILTPTFLKYFMSIESTQNNQNGLINANGQSIVTLTTIVSPFANPPQNPAKNLVWNVSDYGHNLQWNGEAWQWAPGEIGSGFFGLFLAAPSTAGWHLCDGSTVNMLNANATLSQVVLPNYSTATYLKMAQQAAIGPNAASGSSAAVSGGTPAGTLGVESADLADVAVTGAATAAGQNHTHTFTGAALAAHSHGPGNLDLVNSVLAAYFRQ
jgi:hypothetical protein